MKRVFLLGVIGYSVAILLLTHWPAMAANTGSGSAPFLLMMVIDLFFAGFSAFKLFGAALFAEDDGDESTAACRHYIRGAL